MQFNSIQENTKICKNIFYPFWHMYLLLHQAHTHTHTHVLLWPNRWIFKPWGGLWQALRSTLGPRFDVYIPSFSMIYDDAHSLSLSLSLSLFLSFYEPPLVTSFLRLYLIASRWLIWQFQYLLRYFWIVPKYWLGVTFTIYLIILNT